MEVDIFESGNEMLDMIESVGITTCIGAQYPIIQQTEAFITGYAEANQTSDVVDKTTLITEKSGDFKLILQGKTNKSSGFVKDFEKCFDILEIDDKTYKANVHESGKYTITLTGSLK